MDTVANAVPARDKHAALACDILAELTCKNSWPSLLWSLHENHQQSTLSPHDGVPVVTNQNCAEGETNLHKARDMPGWLLKAAKSASPGMVDSAAENVWRQKHCLEQKKACDQVMSNFSALFEERSEHGMALTKEPCVYRGGWVGNSGLKGLLGQECCELVEQSRP